MSSRLRPLGNLKTLFQDQSELLIEPGRTVREILVELNVKPELIAGVIVNGALQTKDYQVQDGDEIKIMSVIGGG